MKTEKLTWKNNPVLQDFPTEKQPRMYALVTHLFASGAITW